MLAKECYPKWHVSLQRKCFEVYETKLSLKMSITFWTIHNTMQEKKKKSDTTTSPYHEKQQQTLADNFHFGIIKRGSLQDTSPCPNADNITRKKYACNVKWNIYFRVFLAKDVNNNNTIISSFFFLS